MAVTRFIPQVWAAELLVALGKAHVFAQEGVVNRNYEGEISQFGDTVHITSVSDPNIGDYTSYTTTTRQQLADARRSLTIDQAKYFDFEIDDIDKRQAKGDVLPEAMRRAAYGLADKVDQYIAGLYTSVPAANALGTVAVTVGTPTDAYDKVLVPLKVKLDEASVPRVGRWVVLPPWVEGRLLLDGRFIKANESADPNTLRNGEIGRAAGFTILTSNNVVNVTGDDYAVMAGTDAAISFAEQINDVEGFRSPTAFTDVLRGLHLWGAKVIRPETLASAVVSQT